MTERELILSHLDAFIRQRPGLDFDNYGDRRLYRQEYNAILRDKHDAERLLTAVSWRESITANDLKSAMRRAFMGRLEWDEQRQELDYTEGQYFPTEYREAACAVLSAALWQYWASDLPAGSGQRLRRIARNELGLGIARRWFDYDWSPTQ